MNRRRVIRNYVVKTLKKDLAPHTQVFKSRRLPLQEMELPAVIVSIDEEESNLFAQIPQEVRKTAQLSIEVIAADNETLESDDVIDDLTGKIEEALHTDGSFHNLIDRCILRKTEIHYVREGDSEQGFARMVFDVSYNAAPASRQDVTDFTGTRVTWNQKEQVA